MQRFILVVEDNPPSRELLCDWLEGEGYEVFATADLAGAFSAVRRRQPDAVLLDVQLGADDGLELAAWMHEQPALAPIPVIAVTAHAMATERERILQSGCRTTVTKPVDFTQLRQHLERCLDLASRRHQQAP